jgi:predicted deacylase
MTAWEGHAPVGSAAFVPSTVTRGRLTLAEHIDGPVSAPLMIAAGARAGRVLWAQAAIHGGEVGGTIARLLARLDLSTTSGAIVAVLAANPLAFAAQTRNTAQDGENMNRVFPGLGLLTCGRIGSGSGSRSSSARLAKPRGQRQVARPTALQGLLTPTEVQASGRSALVVRFRAAAAKCFVGPARPPTGPFAPR